MSSQKINMLSLNLKKKVASQLIYVLNQLKCTYTAEVFDEWFKRVNKLFCDSSIEPEVVLDFKGTVTVAKTTTPIRFQLRGYFAQLLQAKKPSSKSTDKRKVKPKFYGEALTTDDVFQRFEEEETRKEEEKKARALRKETRAQRTTTSNRAHGKGKAKATHKKSVC